MRMDRTAQGKDQVQVLLVEGREILKGGGEKLMSRECRAQDAFLLLYFLDIFILPSLTRDR
jgi:hypothetical protein